MRLLGDEAIAPSDHSSAPPVVQTGRFRPRPARASDESSPAWIDRPGPNSPRGARPGPRAAQSTSSSPVPDRDEARQFRRTGASSVQGRQGRNLEAPPPLASDVERLGWFPSPPAPPRRKVRSSPSRLGRLIRVLFLLSVLATSTFGLLNQDLIQTLSSTPQWQNVEQRGRNAVHAAVAIVAEEPSFAAAAELSSYPVCPSTGANDDRRLERGMDLMRGTVEGERLFDQLVANGICVGTEDIAYNSGYAYGKQSSVDGTWSDSYIIVATSLLRSGETDVLAALLVHEATHIDRYIKGLACNYTDTCTSLPNGVDLDEEIAAHSAEAKWWIEAYGSDGKRFATGYDYGLNRLARAYSEGTSVFDAYVRSIRSDSREGSSLVR